jgi:hypothetical protein
MKPTALLLLFAGSSLAAIGNFSVLGTTAAQALISYTAPDGNACTIQVSLGAGLTPLALDVDPNTFANSNSDLSRPSTVAIGLSRRVVIGQRTAQYATAGTYAGVRHFSRSLQPVTPYFGKITCPSTGDTLLFSFTTGNIPLGQVYGDPFLSDPANPGDQPWPESIGGLTPESFNDPLTGANTVRVGLRGNETTSWTLSFASGFNQGQIAPCVNGAWSNPCGIVAGGSGSTTAGTTTTPLVLRLPMQYYPPWITSYNSGFSIDQVGITLTGFVNTANPAFQVLDACLSANGGISCASAVQQFTAPITKGTITFGQFNLAQFGVIPWLLDTNPRLNSQETTAHYGTGTITNASGTYTLANTGGDPFSLYWITGGAGTIRISTTSQTDACVSPPAVPVTAAEYRIAALTDPTGAGLHGNYIQFAPGSTPPTGSVYWCEQNFAVMVWRDKAPTDGSTVTLSAASFGAIGSYAPGIPDNGAGTACFNQPVYNGFFCLFGAFYWINPTAPSVVFWGQPEGSSTVANPWYRVTAPMSESAQIDQTQSNFTFYMTGTSNPTSAGPLVIRAVFTPTAAPAQPTTPQGGGGGYQVGNASVTSTDNTYSETWSTSTPSPWSMTWTNLTPQITPTTCMGAPSAGCGIVQQMAVLDPTFIPSELTQTGGWNCSLTQATSQGIYFPTCFSGYGDSPGWILAFSPGDGNPAHAGQAGGPQIIGAINTFNTPKGAIAPGQGAMTGHNLHTVVESGETGWVMIDANETPPVTSSNTAIPSTGPAKCNTFSSTLSSTADCIAIQMNSYTYASVTGFEPYFPAPPPLGFLGTPGEVRTTQLGDTACFSTSSPSCNWAGQANELMTVRIKNYSGTPGLTVFQRGTYGVEVALSASPYYLRWESYQSSSAVCSYCASQAVQVWWNPLTGCAGAPDPHGNCMLQDPNISVGHGEYRSGGESVTLNVPTWALPQSVIGSPTQWPGDYQVELGAVPSFFSLPSANEVPYAVPGVNFVSINPPFDGVFGTPFAGDAQTHPNPPGANASAHELSQGFDNVPLTGESSAPSFSLVSGQLYRHRPGTVVDPDDFYSAGGAGTPATGGNGATFINRKILATAASCGSHPLIDVSGPGSSIGATSASAYTYCMARQNGECYSGSLPGDVYANCPGVILAGCNAGSYHPGTPFGVGNDICFNNLTKVADSAIQYTLQSTDYFGAYTRSLASATSRLRMVTNLENNALLPDNSWLLYRQEFLNYQRQDLWMLQMPPYPPPDSVNRGAFVPISVAFNPPAGTNNTVIDFGYQEYAQSGVPYCTTRLDLCEATAATIPSGYQPFKFSSEAPTGIACSSPPCTITIPAISQRELYYRFRYQNSSGATIQVGPWQIQQVP